jgi:hypothetical protein
VLSLFPSAFEGKTTGTVSFKTNGILPSPPVSSRSRGIERILHPPMGPPWSRCRGPYSLAPLLGTAVVVPTTPRAHPATYRASCCPSNHRSSSSTGRNEKGRQAHTGRWSGRGRPRRRARFGEDERLVVVYVPPSPHPPDPREELMLGAAEEPKPSAVLLLRVALLVSPGGPSCPPQNHHRRTPLLCLPSAQPRAPSGRELDRPSRTYTSNHYVAPRRFAIDCHG